MNERTIYSIVIVATTVAALSAIALLGAVSALAHEERCAAWRASSMTAVIGADGKLRESLPFASGGCD